MIRQQTLFEKICNCLRWSRQRISSYELIKTAVDIPIQSEKNKGKKTLILDLDETLVHSSFDPLPQTDLTVTIKLKDENYKIYVCIRPGAQHFIRELAQYYEIFIFTASISEYANPVIDYLDPEEVVQMRLFRENCTNYQGLFVKDLSLMKRSIHEVILIDNSVNSFIFQPLNAIHITNFFQDKRDQELFLLIPFLKLLSTFQDVRPVHEWLFKYANLEQFKYIDVNGEEIVFTDPPTSSDTGRENIDQLDTPKVEEYGILIKGKCNSDRNTKDVQDEIEIKIQSELETSEKCSKSEANQSYSEVRNSLNINSPHADINKICVFPNVQSKQL